MKTLNTVLLISMLSTHAWGQTTLTVDEAVKIALQNNGWVRSATLNVQESQQLRKTATEMDPFTATWMNGQYNSLRTDNNLTFQQTLPLPGMMAARSGLGREQVRGAEYQLSSVRQGMVYEVREAFDQLLFLLAYHKRLMSQDTLLRESAVASAARYRAGDITLLENMTAETRALESANRLRRAASDIQIQESKLRYLLRIPGSLALSGTFMRMPAVLQADTAAIASHPRYLQIRQQGDISKQQERVERQGLLPQLTVGLFSQTLIGYQKIDNTEQFYGSDKRFTGFTAGVSLPLWARPQLARARAAGLNAQARKVEADQTRHQMHQELEEAVQQYQTALLALEYYENSANKNADVILRQAQVAYRKGELSYTTYLQTVQGALDIQLEYLRTLRTYNQSVLRTQYLTGQFNN